MRCGFPLILVFLAGVGIERSVPDIISFTGADDQYDGEMIYQLGVGPIGRIDDYAEFRMGSYLLQFSAPNDFTVSIKLYVGDDGIDVEVSKYRTFDTGGCRPKLKTEWVGVVGKSRRTTELGTIWEVTIPGFRVIGRTDTSICSSGYATFAPGACTRHAYALSVDTVPKNAEIWIDNKRIEYRTPAKNLQGSYCDGDKEIRIMTRLDGLLTCIKTFALYPDVEVEFFCDMKDIGGSDFASGSQ